MNCFNHPDQASVATCTDCGKGLCKDCASIYQIPICSDCNQKRVKGDKQAIYKQYIPSALFFIAGFIFGYKLYDSILYGILMGYSTAGIFWGWKVLTFIQPKMFLFLSFAGWGLYFIFKLALSMLVGIVAMPLGIGRIIFKHIAANSKAKNIKENKEQGT